MKILRSTVFAAPISLGILLAGCDPTNVSADLATFITKVQQTVATACGVAKLAIPTAKTIVDILATDIPGVKTVEGMVDLIVSTVCPESAEAQYRAPRAPKAPAGLKIDLIVIPK